MPTGATVSVCGDPTFLPSWDSRETSEEPSRVFADRLGPRSTAATTHDVQTPVLPREGRENEESEVYSPFYWALPASKQGGSMCQEQQGT